MLQFFTDIGQTLADLWGNVEAALENGVDYLNEFLSKLEYIESQIELVNNFITNGTPIDGVDSVTFLELIQTYRFVVGDVIYMSTYTSILIGCGYIIYRLIRTIISRVTNMLSGVSVVGGQAVKQGFIE